MGQALLSWQFTAAPAPPQLECGNSEDALLSSWFLNIVIMVLMMVSVLQCFIRDGLYQRISKQVHYIVVKNEEHRCTYLGCIIGLCQSEFKAFACICRDLCVYTSLTQVCLTSFSYGVLSLQIICSITGIYLFWVT